MRARRPDEEALKFFLDGGMFVADFRDLLAAVGDAYNKLAAFDTISASYEARFGRSGRRIDDMWRTLRRMRDIEGDYSSLVAPGHRLVLSAARFSSPGWFEVIGNLNPLEVIRKYLDDRHKRQQDREYRNAAEKRRLELENMALENSVFTDRIAMMKELGATNADLLPLLNTLIYEPLERLGEFQDRRMIKARGSPDLQEFRPREE
jgi:hypothetical protein